MNELTPVFAILADTALKGVVLIAAAAIAAYLLRRKSAAARHAVWTAAVLGHLALPILTLLVPQWRIPLLPAPEWLAFSQVSQPSPVPATDAVRPATITSPSNTVTDGGIPAATAVTQTASESTPSNEAATGTSASTILGILWILGTALVLLRLAVGTWQVGRLAKHGDRVDDGEWLSLTQRVAKRLGITRPLILLRGDSLAVPVTWGVVYPAVLLPPESEEWPEARRRFVLVHEMAHVKRFDALTQLLAQVTAAMLWFDPLIWYAVHRMRVEREHACDDYVIRDGTTPSLYAGDLLEMVQSIGTTGRENTAPAFAALAMARRSEFEGRMLAILDKRLDRNTLGRRHTILATITLVILVLPLAALRPFASVATASTSPIIVSSLATTEADKKSSTHVPISEMSCDSVMSIPIDRSRTDVKWTHLHVLEDQSDRVATLEFLSYNPGRCAQVIIHGPAVIEKDELVSLPGKSHVYFRELSATEDRLLRLEPSTGDGFAYKALVNGKAAGYGEATQRWISRILPEALKETAVNAPERTARWVTRGGVDRALAEIRRINNSSAKRIHYLALIEGTPLDAAQRAAIRDHATRYMPAASSDRKAVLEKLGPLNASGGSSLQKGLNESSTSSDSARVLTQFARTDDEAMILMALQGAKELSSDTDRRVLLQAIAPRALGKKNAVLRKAFFDATAEMTSDEDLRVTFTTALTYARTDPEITLAVFKAVTEQMSSDSDRRVTLQVVISQKLLTTSAIRLAFMTAVRSMSSDEDIRVLMQAAMQQ